MERYKYYVYISHARKDGGAAAVFLRRRIGHFRIPVRLVEREYLPEDPDFPGPVFCDLRGRESSEYVAGEEVLEALASSRYLLVICSPAAVRSLWVHKEIEYFLASHGNDHSKIVPVILEGRPGSGGEDECLPPLLRTPAVTSRSLPSMIPDEEESRREGWENGLIQVLGYMLHLDRQKIAASIGRKRFRRMRVCADIGLVTAVVLAALMFWTLRIGRTAARNELRAVEGRTQALQSAEQARSAQARAERNAGLARKNELEARKEALLAVAKEREAGVQAKRAESGEREAGKQAEIARKSLDFLRSVLLSADATGKGDKDLKLLESIKAKLPEIPELAPWQLRASVSVSMAILLGDLGEYDTALRLGRDALKLHETRDPQNPEAAAACACIGSVYAKQGKFDEALKFYRKALEIRLKTVGDRHPDTVASYSAVASVYSEQGKFDDALKFYRKALAISSEMPERFRLETARICSGIAAVRAARGEYGEALKFHKKALEFRIRMLGEHHPDTARSCNNIALVYSQQGNFGEALKFYEKALKVWLEKSGELDPDTAKIYNNIAAVHAARGRFDEALKFHRKALTIRSQTLGELHPDIAASCSNIGSVYAAQGKFADALQFYRRALAITEKTPGEHRPAAAALCNDIARVCSRQGKLDDALKFHREALEIRLGKFGALHPETAASYNNIAVVLWKKGDRKEALKNMEKAVSIVRKVLPAADTRIELYEKNLAGMKAQFPKPAGASADL